MILLLINEAFLSSYKADLWRHNSFYVLKIKYFNIIATFVVKFESLWMCRISQNSDNSASTVVEKL